MVGLFLIFMHSASFYDTFVKSYKIMFSNGFKVSNHYQLSGKWKELRNHGFDLKNDPFGVCKYTFRIVRFLRMVCWNVVFRCAKNDWDQSKETNFKMRSNLGFRFGLILIHVHVGFQFRPPKKNIMNNDCFL